MSFLENNSLKRQSLSCLSKEEVEEMLALKC